MNYKILQGDNRITLKTIPSNSIDAIVTDPPYGIDFLGKDWDANTGALETYQECLRVLKPGGHILAFSAARTYHHLAITLEKAGFEIRDQIMWIYSSGFPKSQDVGRSIQRSLGVKEKKAHKHNVPRNGGAGDTKQNKSGGHVVPTDPVAKQWSGWGTALKPAHEPICMARKPLKQSIARNCQEWGVGALNIDATRIPADDLPGPEHYSNKSATGGFNGSIWNTGDPGGQVDDYGILKSQELGRFPSNVFGDISNYQKYFYCPKVSRAERHMGFELPPPMFGDVQGCYGPDGNRMAVGFDNRAEGKTKKKKHDPLGHIATNPEGLWDDGLQYQERKQSIATIASMLSDMGGYYIDNQGNKTDITSKNIWLPQTGNIYIHGLKEEYRKWCESRGLKPDVGNNHPTVKPVELMKYLIKLITPAGGTVLDPFNGSGSTGMAAVELGYTYIGCELDTRYIEISQRRIEAWYKQTHTNNFSDLFELC